MVQVTTRELHLRLASIEKPSEVFAFSYTLMNALRDGCITEKQYYMFQGDLALHLKTI
jgi:hypothetical protein